jgi:hypothetical protein
VFCPDADLAARGSVPVGVVSEIPKRNGWTIAQHSGDRAPDRTQRLLNRAVWDTVGVASQVRRFACVPQQEADLDTDLWAPTCINR